MQDDPAVTEIRARLEQALQRLTDWQRGAPRATFAEIEDAVEEQVARLRAQLIADLVTARADRGTSGGEERAACLECGRAMERRGEKQREVTVRGNQTVRFRRRYAVCPTCQVGVFPPRRGTGARARGLLASAGGGHGLAGDPDSV